MKGMPWQRGTEFLTLLAYTRLICLTFGNTGIINNVGFIRENDLHMFENCIWLAKLSIKKRQA